MHPDAERNMNRHIANAEHSKEDAQFAGKWTPFHPRFAIGQQFIPIGKRKDVCTVTDILRTYNAKNELVSIRYVATHEFMGQTVTDHDVCEATIARGAA